MTSYRAGAATDVGQVRGDNQDLYLVTDSLFAVADGMGGHRGGKIASRLAIDGLQLYFTRPTIDELVHAVERANDAVMSQARRDPELKGMGTTLCALAAVTSEGGEDHLGVINVGDSRAYLLLDDTLYQITTDHSLVEMLVEEGSISRADAAHHPQRNVVTRALGIDTKVMVDSYELLPVSGDRYLVCSDGLFNEVAQPEIVATLRHFVNPDEAAHELVHLANEGGGRDNITCVVVDVVEGVGQPLEGAPGGRVLVSTTGQHRAIVAVTERPPPSARHDHDGEVDVDLDHETDDYGEDAVVARGSRRLDDLPRPRRVTWRVGVFAFLFLLALVVAVFAIGFSARNTFYVGFSGENVAIFRGRPGGVLWIDPTIEETTNITRSDLPARLLADIEEGKDEDSLDSSREYIEMLREETGVDEVEDLDGTSSGSGTDPPRGVAAGVDVSR
jgi:protein phosphatase